MINKDYFIDMFIVRSSLLSATFLFTFLLSSSQAQETTSKVLYAGITIEGVESWMAEEFEKKFEDIFIDIKKERLLPLSVARDLASNEIDTLFQEITDYKFNQVSQKLDVAYIFAGKFKNVSPDDRKVMIQGEFYRYNVQLNTSYRYEVLRYYERMDSELGVIKLQMVESLPSVTTPSSLMSIGLLFGAILLVGLLLMSMAGTDYNSTGDGTGGTPVTPA